MNRQQWAGHVARMGKTRTVYKILGNVHLEDLKQDWWVTWRWNYWIGWENLKCMEL